MVRSLYDGISGLRTEQVAMDVTGNNIANVSTYGFKSGRVTFKESMAQMLKGASRPPGMAGGTNPMQIGLGTAVGSIDTIITQGNLQSTGQITDLALEGQAYFVYSSGEGDFYSRLGALQFDSTGRLVSPTNGFALQGLTAALDGTYPASSRIGDIRVPYGEKAPAKATTEVTYGCNLDSDSEALGTIDHTNAFFANSRNAGTDELASLYDSKGNSLGIKAGDTITISVSNIVPPTTPIHLAVTGQPTPTTLEDLRAAISQVANQVNPGFVTVQILNGQIVVTNTGATTIQNLQVTSDRPGSSSFVTSAFNLPPDIASGQTVQSSALLRPAESADLVSSVMDAAGQTLGLEDGDTITVNGSIGGSPTVPGTLAYLAASTTLGDVLNTIQQTFGLPATDGTIFNNPSISMNPAGTADDLLPDGSIVVRGAQGKAFSVTNLSLTANNFNLNNVAPTRFNSNSQVTELQAARDPADHSTSVVVYDQSGDAHTLTTTFTPTNQPGQWLWEITTNGGEQILGGNRGTITFGQDGSPSAMIFQDGSTRFRFDPMNGSNEVDVALNVGSPGSFTGITQFRSPSTTAAREQDGYPMGKLQQISIDEFGEITGQYTNGVNKSIARIMLAEFNNPAGLLKADDSMFAVSNNSGMGVMLQAGIGTPTKIKPGALEMSNVDLATEFTNMITTERGYQANARVITTSDNMLQELVQLVR